MTSEICALPEDYDNYDFDKNEKPVDIFQVVDADSSQQDAILYAKKGISFVLQGPPGTGKRQTITNIISECLADGKKVLFVSEKMAALEVVYNRLKKVGLSDFCLRLHSYKANKKEVLSELGRTLNMNRLSVKDEAIYELEVLQNEKQKLNQYDKEVHEICKPLGKSIYMISGKLSKLTNVPEIIFNIDSVSETTIEKLNTYRMLLTEFSHTISKMNNDYDSNSWKDSTVKSVTHELRHDIETNFKSFKNKLDTLFETCIKATEGFQLDFRPTLENIKEIIDILSVSGRSVDIPQSWVYESDIKPIINCATNYKTLEAEYNELRNNLLLHNNEGIFKAPAKETLNVIAEESSSLISLLNKDKYNNLDAILDNKSAINSDVKLIMEYFQNFV